MSGGEGRTFSSQTDKGEQLVDAILSALLVIVRTPHIRLYLEQTEPKALEQAIEAIELEAVRLAGGLSMSVIVSELHDGVAG